MSRAKPPCYNGGKDCPRRYVGCRAGCEEWHKWLAEHDREQKVVKEGRNKDRDVTGFLVGQSERKRRCSSERHENERRMGLK